MLHFKARAGPWAVPIRRGVCLRVNSASQVDYVVARVDGTDPDRLPAVSIGAQRECLPSLGGSPKARGLVLARRRPTSCSSDRRQRSGDPTRRGRAGAAAVRLG
uniref:Uncharacterized protein n=1 Tax=Rhodopseudomonas palustris (strain BisA53) TaxID=316055 RepID=Q07Q67_RHOP5